tara:strand:+ start:47982 stop:48719 length:738 start_codon:yes stop_codon:yes gene_type:complete
MNLELSQVSKQFGQIKAMDNVSLSVGEDVKTLVLIGPSGGGKSTLLRVLAGLQKPDSGVVNVEGHRVEFDDREKLLAHRRRNGFVFQSWNLFPHLSALQNITLPLEQVHGLEPAKALELAEAQLERFHLSDHGSKQPAQLSGGQQQRVALARAIAPKPSLVLLDEPTSALDPEMTAEVLELIEELCEEGQNLVLSTHEMGFARAVADRIVFLAQGKVIASESPEKLFDQTPDPEVARFVAKVMRY